MLSSLSLADETRFLIRDLPYAQGFGVLAHVAPSGVSAHDLDTFPEFAEFVELSLVAWTMLVEQLLERYGVDVFSRALNESTSHAALGFTKIGSDLLAHRALGKQIRSAIPLLVAGRTGLEVPQKAVQSQRRSRKKGSGNA